MKESEGWDAVIALIEKNGWWNGEGGIVHKPKNTVCLGMAVNSIGVLMGYSDMGWCESPLNLKMRQSIVEAIGLKNWAAIPIWNDSHTEEEVRALVGQLRSEAMAREMETREKVVA